MSTETKERTEEQTVVFVLGNESYGIDIFRVNEIIRLREITPIPKSDAHIRGLVNLRGKTIPVIDLNVRLSIEKTEETDDTRIIVVDTDQGNVGLVVDSVREVVTFKPEDIQDAPSLVTHLSEEFVRGVASVDENLITLLDLDKALAA
ncbi:MAG: purine-binding chemotaxis protein CheW [Armatimonadetes bacterium]|nr:purine-binding chemotaxis protein CheW [Armatimonadota bacterium]